MAELLAPAASHDHDHKPYGWRRWVYATNHKDIGTMYLVFACTMFFIGGFLEISIPARLFTTRLLIFSPRSFPSTTPPRTRCTMFTPRPPPSARLSPTA